MLFRYVVALSAVALARAQDSTTPKVVSMQVTNQSLAEHHTDHFRIEGGFAVRRGQHFYVVVETDKPLDKQDHVVRLENDKDPEWNSPKFRTAVKKQLEANTYLVEVALGADAPIGRYTDMTLTVSSKSTRDAFTYEYPFPLYVLFNPWSAEDKWVHLPTEELRQEHVLNEYGNVYQGSVGSYGTTKWYYGQGNEVTLEAVFHLLDKFLNRSLAGDALAVVQTLSQNQGMMRKKDGSVMVGSEDSLLEGNWGDFPFTDEDSPEIWSSTTDILQRWKKTGKPTKYGQCWVFGALQTTTMRAIGVGSRQLTAFGAWMDASARRDVHHKSHHVADEFYDINGTVVYMESQAWNFHSWTDIYLNRQDLGAKNAYLSGWQSLDGTPPGKIGPAPVRAIHDLTEEYPFQVADVTSTVHSTQRTFLVECDANHTRKQLMTGCHIQKLLKYDHHGLPLILSSLAPVDGEEPGEWNITGQFVDPDTDAFIPFDPKDTKPLPGRRLRALQDAAPAAAARFFLKGDAKAVDAVQIVPKSFSVIVGQPIDGEVQITTAAFKEDEHITVNMMFTLETRTGSEVKVMGHSSQRVLVKGRLVTVPYHIEEATYLQKDLGDFFVRIVVTGVSDSGEHFFDKEVLVIDSPPVSVTAPRVVDLGQHARKSFPVSASFDNPLPFTLRNVCIKLHSHVLDFVGMADNVTSIEHCEDLKAGHSINIQAELETPTKAGKYYVVAGIAGEYLPFQQGSAALRAVPEVKDDEVFMAVENRLSEIDFSTMAAALN